MKRYSKKYKNSKTMRKEERREILEAEEKVASLKTEVKIAPSASILYHKIVKVLLTEDCTEEYAQRVRRRPNYKILRVIMDVDCYGETRRTAEYFLEPNWEYTQKKGYYYR